MMPAVQELYEAFDRVYKRPKSFTNEGCCVKKWHEKPLLTLPREQLTEEMLDRPMSHACGCFGTLEEVSYYVPRLIEIMAESENGLELGTLDLHLPWLLLENREEYEAKGLWELIERVHHDIWFDRTSSFTLLHVNGEYPASVDLIGGILKEFLHPLLSERQSSTGVAGEPERTGWDDFVAQWADDDNPHRVAHLLDFISRNAARPDFADFPSHPLLAQSQPLRSALDHIRRYQVLSPLPASLILQLQQTDYAEELIDRVAPAIEANDSASWLMEVRENVAGIRKQD